MKLDNVRPFSGRIVHIAQTPQVYRSRSPTNHVTFQVDDARRKLGRHRRRFERKSVQKRKSGEGRLAGLEARMQLCEDKFQDMEDQDDLMKKYKELSEAQNHFIEAQKIRISELEKQGTAHAGELSRTCQLNRDLSATIHSQNMTICDLEQRLAESASNYASSCLNYATQDDIFTEFFPSNHNISYHTEVAESATTHSPALSQWQIKESASPNLETTAWQKSEILKEDGFSCQM